MNSELINLINANIAPSYPGDKIDDAEVRAVLLRLANQISSDVPYTPVIPFNNLVSFLGTKVLTANEVYTPDTNHMIAGGGAILRLVGNGTNVPVFQQMKRSNASQNYVATAGITNVILFFFDGNEAWYTIYQDTTVSIALQLQTPILSALAVSANQINLNWGAIANATGYVLEKSTNQTNWQVVSSSLTGTTYSDAGLTAVTTFYYRLKAIGAGYTDSLYGVASATTLAGAQVQLATPVVTIDQITSSGMRGNWGLISNATGYTRQIATDAGFTSILSTITGAGLNQIFSGLNSNTPHWVRVKATAPGFTDSDWGVAQASTSTPQIPQLATPAVIIDTVTQNSFRVGWGAIAGATQYQSELSPNPNFIPIISQGNSGGLQQYFFGLNPNTIYYTRVKAMAFGYADSNYGQAQQLTLSNNAPQPTGLLFEGDTNVQMYAEWVAPVGGADDYEWQISTAADYSVITQTNTTASLNVLIAALTANTHYYFRVRARKAGFADSLWTTANAFTFETGIPVANRVGFWKHNTGVTVGGGGEVLLWDDADGVVANQLVAIAGAEPFSVDPVNGIDFGSTAAGIRDMEIGGGSLLLHDSTVYVKFKPIETEYEVLGNYTNGGYMIYTDGSNVQVGPNSGAPGYRIGNGHLGALNVVHRLAWFWRGSLKDGKNGHYLDGVLENFADDGDPVALAYNDGDGWRFKNVGGETLSSSFSFKGFMFTIVIYNTLHSERKMKYVSAQL